MRLRKGWGRQSLNCPNGGQITQAVYVGKPTGAAVCDYIFVSADIHAMTGSVCRVAATKFYEVVDASLTPKQYVARCDKHKFDRRQRKDWNDIPESVYLVAEVMES